MKLTNEHFFKSYRELSCKEYMQSYEYRMLGSGLEEIEFIKDNLDSLYTSYDEYYSVFEQSASLLNTERVFRNIQITLREYFPLSLGISDEETLNRLVKSFMGYMNDPYEAVENIRVKMLDALIEYFNSDPQPEPDNTRDLERKLYLLSTIYMISAKINFLERKLAILGYYYNSTTAQTLRIEENGELIETEKSLPYKIALLNEIGFFKIDKIKNLNKTEQRKIIRLLIGGGDRDIKGNISVLDPKSTENRLKYTAENYVQDVKKYFL